MKLQYLGTAAAEGWPAMFCRCPACKEARARGGKDLRTRSQAILDDTLLLDFCPDTYMHMLLYNVDLPNLKHCLITHTHEDHFYIEDTKMRCPWFANDIDDVPFTLYGNDQLVRRMEAYKAGPQGELWTIGMAWQELSANETAIIAGYRVTPVLANHNPKEKCFNYVIEKDGRTLLYGHDSGPFFEETWAQLKRFHFDFVTLDCTMGATGISGGHMCIEDCVKVRERMLAEGMATENTIFFVNHFSHNGGHDREGNLYLHDELVARMQKDGFQVSYDGLTVEF